MKIQQGISLIELIVFIMVVGITASSVLVGMNRVLTGIYGTRNSLQANQLAQARMEIILQQRNLWGVNNFIDPCSSASPPTVCSALSTFASTNGLTVTTPTINTNGTNYQLITVSVSSNSVTATVQSRVARYENPINP